MARIVDFQIESKPQMKIIGKALKVNMEQIASNNPIGGLWETCFEDGTFEELEKSPDYLLDPSYVGWMGDFNPATGDFIYICGMLAKPDMPVPKGYVSRKLPASEVSVTWVQGGSTDEVCQQAHCLSEEKLREAGYMADMEQGWSMEVYNCPRFTQPDETGNIILDYWLPCRKAEA